MNFLRNEFNFTDENPYSEAELLSSSFNSLPFSFTRSPPIPFPFPNTEQTTKDISQNNLSSEKEKKDKFIIKRKEKNSRGRKKKRKNSNETYNVCGFIHNKLATDNLLRKVQVGYLSFIPQYSNEMLKKFGIKESFVKLDYKIKRNVNKKNVIKLKELNIGQILCFCISPKFTTKKKDFNFNLYNKVICNPIIKNILSENYLTLFRNVYYPNERKINLEKYGLNDTLILSKKVKTYEDLLLKNRLNIEADKDDEYFKKLEKCIENNV